MTEKVKEAKIVKDPKFKPPKIPKVKVKFGKYYRKRMKEIKRDLHV